MTKTIFYDVDTQNDFMNKDGGLYVPGAESIKGNLELLTKTAVEGGIPVFGSVDLHFGTSDYRHREGELIKHGGPFPEHCIADTEGQKKIKETLHEALELLYLEHNLDWDANVLSRKELERKLTEFLSGVRPNSGRGVFFEKQNYDVSTNPYFERALNIIKPEVAFVYGVATDYCVKAAVKGLVNNGVKVYVVTDAISGITKEGVNSTLEEFKSLGVKFITTKEVVRGAL